MIYIKKTLVKDIEIDTEYFVDFSIRVSSISLIFAHRNCLFIQTFIRLRSCDYRFLDIYIPTEIISVYVCNNMQ